MAKFSNKLAIANEFNGCFCSFFFILSLILACVYNQLPIVKRKSFCFALQNQIFSRIDGMSNLIAKTCSYGIVPFLKKKIEITSKIKFFATTLAQVVVKSLYKAASKLDVSNYRPISFHLTWSKLFEKAIFIRVYSFLERNSIICQFFVFRAKPFIAVKNQM